MQGHSGRTVDDQAEPIRRGKVGCNIETIIYFRDITSFLSNLSYLCYFSYFHCIQLLVQVSKTLYFYDHLDYSQVSSLFIYVRLTERILRSYVAYLLFFTFVG